MRKAYSHFQLSEKVYNLCFQRPVDKGSECKLTYLFQLAADIKLVIINFKHQWIQSTFLYTNDVILAGYEDYWNSIPPGLLTFMQSTPDVTGANGF